LRLERLFGLLAYELELSDFFRLCRGGCIILARTAANRGFVRFQGRQPLCAKGQFLLKRLEAVMVCREFLPPGVVERLRFQHLAFEHGYRCGLDFQFMLRLLQQFSFESEIGRDFPELLCDVADGQVSEEPSDHAADARRDEETSYDLADEYGHRLPPPFTRNSMRRLC
jgi:hypothetical protein